MGRRFLARTRARGAVMIEFALSFALFWLVFVSIIEFGRLMYAWNAAAEATNLAARTVAICGKTKEPLALDRASQFLKASGVVDMASATDWIAFTYTGGDGGACADEDSCVYVSAAIQGLKAKTFIPIVNNIFNIPASKIVMVRESFSVNLPRNATISNSFCS